MRASSGKSRSPLYLAVAVAIVGIGFASGPAAAGSTPLGKNLVKNPGAESGGTGTNVPNWEISPDFSVGAYGDPGLPSTKQSKAVDGGSQLFSTGAYVFNFDTCGSALQTIKLKGVDGAGLTLKAAMGTETKADTAYVSLQFRDGNNHQIGPNVELSASTKAKMVQKTKTATVPNGARSIRLLLQGDLIAQTCDAFFDNVSVVLD